MISQKVKLVTYGVTTYVYLPRWWVKMVTDIEGRLYITEGKINIEIEGVLKNETEEDVESDVKSE